MDDVVGLDLGDVGAAARADVDQAHEREALDRLAQRRAAEPQLVHQPVLAQRGAGRQAQRDDAVPQGNVRAVGDQRAVRVAAVRGLTRGGH